MKESYADDTMKEKTRAYLREFIGKNLSFLKPKDIHVLHLPGPEMLEWEEVYKPLGIPAKNVTGLERDPAAYAALAERNHNVGMQIYRTDDVSFLETAKQQGRRWQIVSLDYVSPYNQRSFLYTCSHAYFLPGCRGGAISFW
ncbi:hypothetical protein HZB02_04510 [Candidatus Woesearchaeota archaeon]|nr:hypothetical protein [Candidatus Woesearchaeota archaeon]